MLRTGTVLAMLAIATSSSAQTTAQFPIQFDFLNPGARSLALGSAFTGLADDATAAFTNPAGLLQLSRPEISFEGRYRSVETPFLSSGRVSGNPLNLGEDRTAGPVYAISNDRHFGPSFLSFTYPRRRWAIAGYRHELSRVENEFLYRGVFERATIGGITDDRSRDNPLAGARTITIDNYGASFAYRVNDRVNVGAGVALFDFGLDASFRRVGLPDLFGAPDVSQTGSNATQTSDDRGLGASIGVQVQLTPKVRLGSVFRKAPQFDYVQVENVPFRPTITREGRFQVPDTVGVGLAWRPTDTLLFAGDYVRVGYSALKEDFFNLVAIQSGLQDRIVIDDGHELHFGAEWVLPQLRFTPGLRGGFWLDPDHSVRYISDGSNSQLDTRFRFILPGGEDLWHYTFGVGLSLSRALEVNGAADITKRSSYVSGSVIVRFF